MIIPIAVHQPTLFRSKSFSFALEVQAVSDSFNHNLPDKVIHENYLRGIVKPYGKGPYSQIFLQIFNSVEHTYDACLKYSELESFRIIAYLYVSDGGRR